MSAVVQGRFVAENPGIAFWTQSRQDRSLQHQPWRQLYLSTLRRRASWRRSAQNRIDHQRHIYRWSSRDSNRNVGAKVRQAPRCSWDWDFVRPDFRHDVNLKYISKFKKSRWLQALNLAQRYLGMQWIENRHTHSLTFIPYSLLLCKCTKGVLFEKKIR